MARQSNEVRLASDLPSWFRLNKYETANTLDAAGWYEQLMVREKIIHMLATATKADLPLEGFSEINGFIVELLQPIQESPILDVMANDVLRHYFCEWRLCELKRRQPRDSFGVRLVTARDFYQIENSVQREKRTHIRAWSAQTFGKFGWGESEPDSSMAEYQDWFDDPIDSFVDAKGFGYTVRVNPLLPEKVLIEQFKSMLQTLRVDDFVSPPKPNFSNWIRFGVLPYLDLWVWGCVTGNSIPNRVMADAIFPVGEGGEEVVRKTTSKLAIELLNAPNLDTLAAIAAADIAEGNWA